MWARRKLADRETHFYHTLTDTIITECVERNVGTLAVGDLSDIREDENGDSREWRQSGNKKLHGWEFDRSARLSDSNLSKGGVDRVWRRV